MINTQWFVLTNGKGEVNKTVASLEEGKQISRLTCADHVERPLWPVTKEQLDQLRESEFKEGRDFFTYFKKGTDGLIHQWKMVVKMTTAARLMKERLLEIQRGQNSPAGRKARRILLGRPSIVST